ncbi:MAG: sulfate reduction electron transfer complex DsrMKJOP subunit DsrJ [Isosphaeraceae bacterium]
MSDRPKIIVGLVVGLAGLTSPLWYTWAAGHPQSPPQLERPGGQCVEDREYMRDHHMQLLDQWRTAVVREGQRMYVSKAYGTSHEMSLTKTCMGCHTSRETFCDRCHEYAGVASLHPLGQFGTAQLAETRGIGCWDCHHTAAKGN